MGKKKIRPVLLSGDIVIQGNGGVTKLDEALSDPSAQKAYKRLMKRLGANPENVGEKLRAATWSGKSLDDLLRELESD